VGRRQCGWRVLWWAASPARQYPGAREPSASWSTSSWYRRDGNTRARASRRIAPSETCLGSSLGTSVGAVVDGSRTARVDAPRAAARNVSGPRGSSGWGEPTCPPRTSREYSSDPASRCGWLDSRLIRAGGTSGNRSASKPRWAGETRPTPESAGQIWAGGNLGKLDGPESGLQPGTNQLDSRPQGRGASHLSSVRFSVRFPSLRNNCVIISV
jgi:hypothetical protein